ncbi:hypothetical protein B0E47_10635 [Rhodanobacter sp. B05]|jgi:uncharacterized protein (DUF4415 family)|uniref:BrnA antitoxin family protein n=1 Tax=Rhodanobacter sp. B05 TaxID=1945859 RepID=UPI000984B383|nr:BrnA antitoxin family protein [Rhodanobacter sp. B05]OOG55231.1 hypothetical protein B0E47_10635 [Rhodanobacter sp. B05]
MKTEYDFSKAKRAKDVPHLAKLQAAAATGKTRISIMLDDDVIAGFRARAAVDGMGYQTEINRALRASLQGEPVTLETLRKLIREELHAT